MHRALAEPELSHLLEAQRKAILYEIDELRWVLEHGDRRGSPDPPDRTCRRPRNQIPLLELRGQAVGFTEVEVPRHVELQRLLQLPPQTRGFLAVHNRQPRDGRWCRRQSALQ